MRIGMFVAGAVHADRDASQRDGMPPITHRPLSSGSARLPAFGEPQVEELRQRDHQHVGLLEPLQIDHGLLNAQLEPALHQPGERRMGAEPGAGEDVNHLALGGILPKELLGPFPPRPEHHGQLPLAAHLDQRELPLAAGK